MKKTIGLITALLLTQITVSQNIKVIYNKAYKNYKDTTSSEPRIFKDLEYKLIANSFESHFEYIENMSLDGQMSNESYIGKGGGKGIYYKNLNENLKIHETTHPFTDEVIDVYMDPNNVHWELQKESKYILGILCYKAVATKQRTSFIQKKRTVTNKLTAWYAPSIPIPFGPTTYDNLPGLILEAHTSSYYYIASKISYPKTAKIKKPSKGRSMLLEDYNNELKDAYLKLKKQNSTN